MTTHTTGTPPSVPQPAGARRAGDRSSDAASTARTRRRDLRQNWLGYVFLSPAAILFLMFIGGPFLVAIVLSLYSWDLLTTPEFVGLENFVKLFQDPVLVQAFANTFLFALASVITHVVGALLLALAVNAVASRVISYLVRTAVFFPFIISWAAVALLWQYMLDPGFGLVNHYIERVGLTPPDWFLDPAWALPAIIGIDFWHTLGFTFIIMLAGLQTVPNQLIEAAKTDGASRWQVFWNVTVPMMSPTLFFAMVVTFIGAFQIFDPVQIITGGGPDDATLTLVMYLYEQGFQAFQIGYASAVAFLVFVVIMVVTLLQFWGSKKWVYEQ
ncbi:carbohydrate ABC transporter permease [Brachybacterium sp. GCM10030252]|uniref:carbohydrate ABC transporter permease n=1 Tax=Brachybacterium sp. GCM10030252 TaxID=3273380 RepID=UPI0036207C59